jgi:pimeloyl-ACP methyl ester carboxylesterase
MPYFEFDSHRIHYTLHNPMELSTRPLVLLHGLGSSADDWPLQLAPFAQVHPTLVVDLRGHGRSTMGSAWPLVADYAADVSALLEKLDKGSAHVVGLSLGGLVALQLTLDWSECVCSLTVVNGFARLRVGWRGMILALVRLCLLGIGRMDWLGAWIAAGIFPDPTQAAWRRVAAQRIASNPRSTYLRAVMAVSRFDVVSRLKEIRVPTMIVAGERDTTIALEAKEILTEGIQGARMVRLPSSGHGTPYDASDRFNQIVLDFLAESEK